MKSAIVKIVFTSTICLLSSGCLDECALGGCKEESNATTITDIQFIPDKEAYSRTDTVLLKVVHSELDSFEFQYTWQLSRSVIMVDSLVADFTGVSKNVYTTAINEIKIVPNSVPGVPLETIYVEVDRENHSSVSFIKQLMLKE